MAQEMTDQLRAEIAEAVREVAVGEIHVQEVTMDERDEPSERYLSVEVMLSDPTAETWPADDFYELRRTVRNAVVHRIGVETEVRLTYVPARGSSPASDTEVEGGGIDVKRSTSEARAH